MKKLLTAIIVFVCYIVGPAWGYDAAHFYNLGLDSTMSNIKINYFTITEYLADSAGRSGSVKGIGWMGAAGMVAIFFVMIFKLTLPPPRKGDEDKDS